MQGEVTVHSRKLVDIPHLIAYDCQQTILARCAAALRGAALALLVRHCNWPHREAMLQQGSGWYH